MIALAILAIVSASIIKISSQALHQSSQLEEKTMAYWVAQNTLSKLQLGHTELAAGTKKDYTVYANRDWDVDTNTQTTADPDLWRVDVTVTLKTDQTQKTSTQLTGFVGKH